MPGEDRRNRPNSQPDSEFVWLVLIALFIVLMLLSGYGLIIIWKAIVSLFLGPATLPGHLG